MLKFLPRPQSSFLQWHITERCNLRCKHCYQTSYETPEMPTEKMLDVVDQYVELLGLWGIKGRMQVTGGEPFVRKDIFAILEKIHENRNTLKFNIMSNGMFITRDIAKRLKDLEIDFFQISIEGGEETNDYIRGKGVFKKVQEAAKLLVEEGISTSFSFTVTSINSKEYFRVLEIAKSLGVNTVWSDRLVPWGSGKDIQEHMLQPLDVKSHYEKVTAMSKELERIGSKTRLSRNRTLYFMANPEAKDSRPWANHCDAVGTRGMTVLPDGTMYPCRRLPIKVGNVRDQSLFEIWYGSEWMWRLRDKNNYRNEKCGACDLFERCGGGAPCIAYGYTGTPFATDPQCWKAFDEIPPSEELAKAAKIADSDKEPEIWEHIIIQDRSRELGDHFELEDGRLYFHNGRKAEAAFLGGQSPSGIYRMNLDASDFDAIDAISKIPREGLKKLFIALLNTGNGRSRENKTKVLGFLTYLKDNRIDFRLTMPLPREWFGMEYFSVSRQLHAPGSWKEAVDLFYVQEGKIRIQNVVEVDGPSLKYLPSRNQIHEYFSFFHDRPRRLNAPPVALVHLGASILK